MLIAAPWPSAAELAGFVDDASENSVRVVIEVVGAVRSARSRYGVSPKEELTVSVKAPASKAEQILQQSTLISSLARISALTASPDETNPSQAVVGIVSDLEVYTNLAGFVDFAEEKAKLEKEQKKLAADLAKLDKKLSNPGFLAKAAPEIIQKDTAKRDEIEGQLEKVTSQLEQM